MTWNPEAALTAVQVLVAAYVAPNTSAPYFKEVGRRLKMPDDAMNQPACFIYDSGEIWERRGDHTPGKNELRPEVFLYSNTDDMAAVPSTLMNADIAAFMAAIAPTGRDLVMIGQQTLGGLAARCYVDGQVLKFPGDLDGQNLAVLPLRILGPS